MCESECDCDCVMMRAPSRQQYKRVVDLVVVGCWLAGTHARTHAAVSVALYLSFVIIMAEQPRARLAPAASTSALPMRRPSAGGTVSPQASASSMAEISRAPSASSSASSASSTSSAAAAAASQRRARSLLKNFYALDKASSEPSVKSDPTNIDHPTFDAVRLDSTRLADRLDATRLTCGLCACLSLPIGL